MPRLSPEIFREYDIRGIFNQTLSIDDAYAIGRAFASRVLDTSPYGGGSIVVGRDGRLSSPALTEALCRGIADSGFEVADIGIGPTPMLYFAVYHLNAGGGVMVTGSHNPPDHNGFKLMLGKRPFYGQDIQALRREAEKGDFRQGKGARANTDVRGHYMQALLGAYNGVKPLRVAWDAGNGATGEVMAELCRRLPGVHVALNAAIDGTFPAHHPDPSVPENLEQLRETVLREQCDLGIAFDGDGDRIGAVDETGEILWGDQLLMLYAAEVLKEKPGAVIIADVKASQGLFDEVARLGGKPLMWKTGHSLIKSKMAETGALLAGEMSGHMFFADRYFGYDDGIYAAVRLVSLLSRANAKLSALRKALPKFLSTPEIRVECEEARKFRVIEEVKARLVQEGAAFSDIDGVRVTTPDGWWLLRASNTQAVLVARCEAGEETGLARLERDLRRQLAASHVHAA